MSTNLDDTETSLQDIVVILENKDLAAKVQVYALNLILTLSANETVASKICQKPNLIEILERYLNSSHYRFTILQIFINLSSYENLLSLSSNCLQNLISCIEHLEVRRCACVVLNNLTRSPISCDAIASILRTNIELTSTCLNFYCSVNTLDTEFIGMFFMNLTQLESFRNFLIVTRLQASGDYLIQKILSLLSCSDSGKRQSASGIARNCCFSSQHHELLLGAHIDILSSLLLPLAGPEEFDDEDNEKLPLDLQYLSSTKEREEDAKTRLFLIEALNQLCNTKFGRLYMRDHNAYVIFRELHNWEKDSKVTYAAENVIDILIGDEPKLEHSTLKDVAVPEKYQEEFEEGKKQLLQLEQ